MADNFALALQKGLRTRLAATSDLTNIVSTRIFDEPPQGVTFPYVRFGDITPAAFDTDTELGAQVSIGIECHSRSASGVLRLFKWWKLLNRLYTVRKRM